LGFDTLSTPFSVMELTIDIGGSDSLALPPFATVHYWRGIKEALEQTGCERVIITRVPRTASIENRAETLRKEIATKCKPGEILNLIAHSMVYR
jgi:triacylglycerol lipase